VEIRNLEKVLSSLPGIHSAKVISDGNGNLTEIHVLASSQKPAKQVVRDVETAIFATSGIKVDRKIISVAQIEGEDERQSGTSLNFKVKRVSRVFEEPQKIEVTIEDAEKEVTGIAILRDYGEKSYLRAVAKATISALAQLKESVTRYSLELLDVLNYPRYPIVVAVLESFNGEKRVEADLVSEDPALSVANLIIKCLG